VSLDLLQDQAYYDKVIFDYGKKVFKRITENI